MAVELLITAICNITLSFASREAFFAAALVESRRDGVSGER
jgi:hypothetical protein